MKKFKIAGLNDTKTQAYTVSGLNFYVPKQFRDTVEVGGSMLVGEKEFTKKTVDGELVDCEPYKRPQVFFAGSNEACVLALNEERIDQAVDEVLVQKTIQKQIAAVAVADAELSSAI